MLDRTATATLPLDTPQPKDATGAERQRRYRDRHRAEPENAETREALEKRLMQLARRDDRQSTELIPRQPQILMERLDNGALVLVQDDWPNEEARIIIAADIVDQFIDRLTDELGYGGVNPPQADSGHRRPDLINWQSVGAEFDNNFGKDAP